jgi:RNA polymerase sigma factor (sigma-70 family)
MKYTKEQKEALYLEHKDYIEILIWHFLNEHPFNAYLKDLIQEMALKFLEILEGYDPKKAALTTLIYLAIPRACSNYCRRESMERKMRGELVHLMEDSYEVDFEHFNRMVDHDNLTEIQKDILRMRFVLGMTYREIAELQDKDESTIRESERSALGKLRGHFELG